MERGATVPHGVEHMLSTLVHLLEWWDDVMSHLLSTACHYLLATWSVVDYSHLLLLPSE